MDRTNETIQKAFNGNEDKYKNIFDCQLHHPLYATGYFLNPEFFCNNPNIEMDCEALEGL
ncbi:hypothetical protein CR513_57434, partial [Mucuna pruriens]